MDTLQRLAIVSPTIKATKVYGPGQPHRLVTCQSLWEYFASILLPGDGIYEMIHPKTIGLLSTSSLMPHFIINRSTPFGRHVFSQSRQNQFILLTYGLVKDLLYHPYVYTPITFRPFLRQKRKYKKSVLLKVPTFLASRLKISTPPIILATPSRKVFQLKIRSPLSSLLKVTRWISPIRSLYQLKICSQLFPRAGVG